MISSIQIVLVGAAFWGTPSVSAFQPVPFIQTTPKTTILFLSESSSNNSNNANPTTPEQMFASEGWQPIKAELDSLPIFCVANEQGQPLQYRVNDETTMPFFYCDAGAAQDELTKARAETQEDVAAKLGIIPFPLGQAFELMAQNRAAIIPSAVALEQAGAPAGTNPLGQQVPLFCCMEVMQARPSDGKPVLPIFMDHTQATAAMQEALATDGPNNNNNNNNNSSGGDGTPSEFEIVSLSLPRAVELLATNAEDAPSFHFLPSPASMEYIQTYLEEDSQPEGSRSRDRDKK